MTIGKPFKKIEPTRLSPSFFGFKDSELTGKDIRVGVLDSGVPDHQDIGGIITQSNFTEDKSSQDHIGHSTCVSGIIAANNKNGLTGLAPQARLFQAKVISDDGIARFDSVIGGVLWAVIKKVDIIYIGMSTPIDNSSLFKAIQKALESGIIIIASHGEGEKTEFPAQYSSVISAKFGEKLSFVDDKYVTLPLDGSVTTYLDNRYIEASNNAIAAALLTGICCRVLEDCKNRKKQCNSKTIVHELIKMVESDDKKI